MNNIIYYTGSKNPYVNLGVTIFLRAQDDARRGRNKGDKSLLYRDFNKEYPSIRGLRDLDIASWVGGWMMEQLRLDGTTRKKLLKHLDNEG